MLSGTRDEPLDDRRASRVADAICFDVAYDDGIRDQVERGGQLLVVQTSNATFIHTDQIDQQFAITRLRAIETHRAVAVAATNGLTGLIAPDGEVAGRRAAPRTQAGRWSSTLPLVRTVVTPGVAGSGPWIGRGAGRRDARRRAAARPGVPYPSPSARSEPRQGTRPWASTASAAS